MQIRQLSGTYSARETLNTFALQRSDHSICHKRKDMDYMRSQGNDKRPAHEKKPEREDIEHSDTHKRRCKKRNIQSHILRKRPNDEQKNKKKTKNGDKVGRTRSEWQNTIKTEVHGKSPDKR